MEKKRILREAQKIAKEFSFWMVSGNIAHLYGYIYETPEKKYELEIKFSDDFPVNPPQFLYHKSITELLGAFHLNKIKNWSPDSSVVAVIHELKSKILNALDAMVKETEKKSELDTNVEYLTPDLDAYPPDIEIKEDSTLSDYDSEIFHEEPPQTSFPEQEPFDYQKEYKNEIETISQNEIGEESGEISVIVNTELGLIQQEYAYDIIGKNSANINVYITITLTKTFIIELDFTNFPKKPSISVPEEVMSLLGNPYENLESLKKWNPKSPAHIVDILHELEKRLYLIKEIEGGLKKIQGEYQCDTVSGALTQLKVHLLTYGFKEYLLDIDLSTYPKLPKIQFSLELRDIIGIPLKELETFKNWKDNESETLDILREISWLVDKNSRIHFEIDLLRENYPNITYDPLTESLMIEMKGKMKTQDITFKFQIQLPREYPMKMPIIKVVNEFELESQEKIKKDLYNSFDNFFSEWTPFSYLIDLFNLISKKIFEVSIVSCVICHKIECPICGVKIAGSGEKPPCHIECPHCEKHYHLHCWEQTIRSFGKCGFCLRQP